MKKIIAVLVLVAMGSGCASTWQASRYNADQRHIELISQADANGVRMASINWLDKGWWDYARAKPLQATGWALVDIAGTGLAAYGLNEVFNGNNGEPKDPAPTIAINGNQNVVNTGAGSAASDNSTRSGQ